MPGRSSASAWRSVFSSRSVTFGIADTTATTGRRALSSAQIFAATRIRSAEPILVPPNFMTRRLVIWHSAALPQFVLISWYDFVWGRLVTCGGLVIRLLLNKKYRRADYQSAAGYQPHLSKLDFGETSC